MTEFKVGNLVRPTRQALEKTPRNSKFDYTQIVTIVYSQSSVHTEGVEKVPLSWDSKELEPAFLPGDILKPSASYCKFITEQDHSQRFTYISSKIDIKDVLLRVRDDKLLEKIYHWHNLELDKRVIPELRVEYKVPQENIEIKEFSTWLNPKNKVELNQEASKLSDKTTPNSQLKLFD